MATRTCTPTEVDQRGQSPPVPGSPVGPEVAGDAAGRFAAGVHHEAAPPVRVRFRDLAPDVKLNVTFIAIIVGRCGAMSVTPC